MKADISWLLMVLDKRELSIERCYDKYLFFIGFGSMLLTIWQLVNMLVNIFYIYKKNMYNFPCTFQCKLVTIDDLELCASCGRTRSEIINWRDMDSIDKQNVFRISNERLLRKLAKIWVREIERKTPPPPPERPCCKLTTIVHFVARNVVSAQHCFLIDVWDI